MFVASSLYNYATGPAAASGGKGGAATENNKVKRHPVRGPRRSSAVNDTGTGAPTSPPPSYASVAAAAAAAASSTSSDGKNGFSIDEALRQQERTASELAKIKVIDGIVAQEDLYEILGVKRTAKTDDIRRGFLNRSRVCHPDKFPSYAPCVTAFQKVSFAYQTLSKPTSRRMYDVSGRQDLAAAVNDASGPGGGGAGAGGMGVNGDETLNSVLYAVFCEFLDGDFEMIRVLVNAMNEGNPGLNLGDEAADSIEGAFRRLRSMLLAGRKYLAVVRFELIRLYEIQQNLRQLSYFDVFGRLRLTLQLARVTLSIPMAIDSAMKEPGENENDDENGGGLADGDTKSETRTTERNVEANHRPGDENSDLSEDASSSSDDGDDEEEDEGEAEFGMRSEDEEEDDDERGIVFNDDDDDKAEKIPAGHTNGAVNGNGLGPSFESPDERRRQRKRRRRREARREARRDVRAASRNKPRRSGIEYAGGSESAEAKSAASSKAVQKKGLLGPTAAGLLKGVVKVLETSEGWVPGGGGSTGNNA